MRNPLVEINDTPEMDAVGDAAKSAGKAVGKSAGKAVGKQVGKAGKSIAEKIKDGIAKVIGTKLLLIVFLFLFFIMAGSAFYVNFFAIYFEGWLGFDSAYEYADVTAEADKLTIQEEVENYYADNLHYEQAVAKANEIINKYLTEIAADNEERFNNGYAGQYHFELKDAECNVNSAEDLFGNGFLQEYMASHLQSYVTDAQLRAIERGGSAAETVIAEIESDLLGAALETYHSQWVWVQEVIEEEERGTGEYDADGHEITETWYLYHNIYNITANKGEESVISEGVDWDVATEDEDEEIIDKLITAEENDETDTVQDGLSQYHESSGTSGSGSLFEKLASVISDILETFKQELFSLKENGPVPKVTTLDYNSSAYAVSGYLGQTAALVAIEQLRDCQYVWGGKSPDPGVDCSGLVYYSYRTAGYSEIAASSLAQRNQCKNLDQFWDYETWNESKIPGDLILMDGHVAMYVGTVEQMLEYGVNESIIASEGLQSGVEYCIEASKVDCDGPGDGVKFSTLMSNIGDPHFVGCGRPYDTTALYGMSGDYATLYNFFRSAGMTPVGAAGLVGNLMAESSLNPMATNPSGYFGLAQWGSGRKMNMVLWCKSNGYDPNSVDGQANFIVYEMRTSYSFVWAHLQTCSSPAFAASDICRYYEIAVGGKFAQQGDLRPDGELLQGLDKRISYATQVYGELSGT